MTQRSLRPDVVQLRALGHPVRLRIIGLLRSHGPATASGLAARLGLNSGATSYHLRQLADAGLIEDDHDRGNARERWWKASYERTSTSSEGVQDPEALDALRGYHDIVVASMLRTVQQSVEERADLPRPWQEAVDMSDWRLTLTPEQAGEVSQRLHRVLDEAVVEFGKANEASNTAAAVLYHLHAFPAPGELPSPGETS